MSKKVNAPVQYLPTPTPEFWRALRVVRNYLLLNHASKLYYKTISYFIEEMDLTRAFEIVNEQLDLTEGKR